MNGVLHRGQKVLKADNSECFVVPKEAYHPVARRQKLVVMEWVN
jgi:hypothetical protein